MHSDNPKISFLDRAEQSASNDKAVEQRKTPSVNALIEESASTITAATKDLVPVFAQHFSDVRLICKRDSLEISASFRPKSEIESSQNNVHDHANIKAVNARPARPSMPAATRKRADNAPTDVDPASRPNPIPSPTPSRRKNLPVAGAGLALLIVAASVIGVSQTSDETSPQATVVAQRTNSPAWGERLSDSQLESWINLKTSFDLPVGTLRSTIQLMQVNDKYPSAHDLHDLSKYPAQALRAFTLLAGATADPDTPLDFRGLKDDLESRLIAGARFPDEASGGRYSSLQRELYNNVIVLGVVDLFYRRQNEPAVRELIAAIKSGSPQTDTGQGV